MNNPMDMSGKRILVTGASAGIGRAVCISLSQLGANVVGVGRNKDELDKTMQQLEGVGHSMFAYDLNDFEHYAQLFEHIRNEGDKLSGMIHCAGIARIIPVKAVSFNNMLETMKINYFSFMELVKHFSNRRNHTESTSVVAVSSINVHYPQKCMSVYSSSKGAIEAAVSSLALELSDKKIRVNSLVAGGIDTGIADMYAGIHTQDLSASIDKLQMLGIGTPTDIAKAACFLLSDASSFITGRQLYVDGGRLL